MSLGAETEKTVEILVSEVGEMTVVLRPPLPFLAEGFRVLGSSLEIFGQGEKIALTIPEDLLDDAAEIDQALLLEYGRNGASPKRETDLLRI